MSKLVSKFKESEEVSLEVKPPWIRSMKGRSSWEGFLRIDVKMEFRVGSPLEDAVKESSEVGDSKLILGGEGLKGGYFSAEI